MKNNTFVKHWNICYVTNCACILAISNCCELQKLPNRYKFIFLFLILVQIFRFSMLWTNAIVVTNYQSCHEELAMITFNNLHLPPPYLPPVPLPPKPPTSPLLIKHAWAGWGCRLRPASFHLEMILIVKLCFSFFLPIFSYNANKNFQ